MKYLHIMWNDKFNKTYIEFIERNFNQNEHYFVFWGGSSEDVIPILDRNNILKVNSKKELIKLVTLMNKNIKIYLHGLFNSKLIFMLYLQPWILKRCNWIVWGGDLYCYRHVPKSIKSQISRNIKLATIRNIGEVSTLVEGDYVFAKDNYNIKGRYKEAFYMLPSTYKDLDEIINRPRPDKKDQIFIQVGNSATKGNNHIEVLNELSKFKCKDIKIFCPLSYGDEEYAQYVAEYGQRLFGNKFIPMLNFMPYDEYTDYLNSVDIGIFNNDRQQALGNIYSLLYLGKKVYIRSDTTMWGFFMDKLNINIYDILKIKDIDFEEFKMMDKNMESNNRNNIKPVFTDEYAINIWERNFD